MKSKVIIDPLVNVYYAGFYLQGLFDKFEKQNIIFQSTPFESIENRSENFNFIVTSNGRNIKYSIHVDDPYDIKENHYNWCDVYGNVNANFDKTPHEYHAKLVSLTPSFGIRVWNFPQTLYYCFTNLLKVNSKVNVRKFIGKYRRQFELRLPLEYYQLSNKPKEIENYIFHLSTLWQSDEWSKNDEGVNRVRANFIRVCKSIGSINFEGGLSFKNDSSIIQFNDVLYNGTMSMRDYIEKTKQSLLVFNTPSFWSCHGWKLGEFLALGKAIISTPLSNDLPVPLEHGVNIHFIENDSEEEIKKAVFHIINNTEYRIHLERGAKEYWNKYGTPIKSLELLGL